MDIGAPHAGKKGRARPEMNVTPLVDVVLVLLITFMVLTAMMNDHFWVASGRLIDPPCRSPLHP